MDVWQRIRKSSIESNEEKPTSLHSCVTSENPYDSILSHNFTPWANQIRNLVNITSGFFTLKSNGKIWRYHLFHFNFDFEFKQIMFLVWAWIKILNLTFWLIFCPLIVFFSETKFNEVVREISILLILVVTSLAYRLILKKMLQNEFIFVNVRTESHQKFTSLLFSELKFLVW